MTMDLAAHKKRLSTMLAIEGVCVIVALAALFADFKYSVPGASVLFVAALVAGIAAQIWFVLGFRKGGS